MTSEGLFRAALDGLPGVAEEADDVAKSQRPAGAVALPVLFSSPLHPYSKAAMLRGYSELLMQWEKREAEGEVTARQAETVSTTPLASFRCLMTAWMVGAVLLPNAKVVSNGCVAYGAVHFACCVSKEYLRTSKYTL